ncbi:MAG TPA: hypothetical protein VHO29_01250 [Marmoricola sp.]|nr:hypothetical protein [Marmoricola sp.]
MGVPYDGGDTATIEAGGSQLVASAKAVGGVAAGIDHAGSLAGGSGDPTIEAALRRYTAAASAMVSALHTQIGAAGQLAQNAAADLDAAGGH